MFEESWPGQQRLEDAALIDAITASARAEATAAADRFAAIAELTDRRCQSELAKARERWACDGWDSAAAEIAAAQSISHRAATTLMHQALALRHRLPRVAALLGSGAITAKMATTLTWRTHMIDDPDVLDAIDADLADTITDWGPLASAKLDAAADAVICARDPAAVLAHRSAVRRRDVQVGTHDDDAGTSSLWGRLLATDGELLTRRLEAMAKSVCRTDPRSLGERRSDALGILIAGGDALPCRCEHSDCRNGGADARADAVVIHVLTNGMPPEDPSGPSDPEPDTDPSSAGAAATPGHNAPPCPSTAVIAGGGIVSAPLLAELARMGAVVRPIADPTTLGVETGYRPSTRLARFVRARDLTCCFHGCNRPAEYCDLDHTVPYPHGPTHPGNVKCVCRKHHLLKTFWTGAGGWHDEQLADGTILWTAPTGHRYRNPPGSRLHFPAWNTASPAPPPAAANGRPMATDRGLAMPLRKRSRTAERSARILRERQRNQDTIDNNPAPF
jgi:hypothetical protein